MARAQTQMFLQNIFRIQCNFLASSNAKASIGFKDIVPTGPSINVVLSPFPFLVITSDISLFIGAIIFLLIHFNTFLVIGLYLCHQCTSHSDRGLPP
ncbi:Protein of unknown function [Pyronema omphalodes CBS 100304]|uniref:Uncharacterized protein n=1 Tax=Pyronema omphalodes (strain CBS 100304) TaxID=1076935 RepID=U4L3S8_PYROM|nr:Protein of unknown function [Pyronema omphalodes CBS 100304]